MVKVEGIDNKVAGVLPKGFELYLPAEAFFVRRPQMWRPARIDFGRLPPRNWTAWTGLGRIRKGVTLEQARQEMTAMGADLRREVPEFAVGDLRVGLIPLDRDVSKGVRGGLLTLMGAVGFVLVIACANVARLLLARGFSREAEFRMRAALGATLVATLLSAVVPGRRAARAFNSPGLLADARSTGSAQRRRLQDRLVIGQVALAVVVGTGLMIQSFRALVDVPLSFEPRGMLILRLALPRSQYPDPYAAREFYRQLEERLRGLPGVTSMAGLSRMVLSGAGPLQTFAYDEETARNWESATADWREVSPRLLPGHGRHPGGRAGIRGGRRRTQGDEARDHRHRPGEATRSRAGRGWGRDSSSSPTERPPPSGR